MKDSDGAEALEVGGDPTPLPHQVTIGGMMIIMKKTKKNTNKDNDKDNDKDKDRRSYVLAPTGQD